MCNFTGGMPTRLSLTTFTFTLTPPCPELFIKFDTRIRLWTAFMCAKFQGDLITHLCFIAIFQSVRKDEE